MKRSTVRSPSDWTVTPFKFTREYPGQYPVIIRDGIRATARAAMGKVSKATKRFSQKRLSDELKARKMRKKINYREKKKWGARKSPQELEAERKAKSEEDGGEEEEEEEEEESQEVSKGKVQSKKGDDYDKDVEDFLEKGFFEALEEEEPSEAESDGEEDEDEDEDEDEGEGEEDDLSDTDAIAKHKQDLERLKVEQPEFYKYLQENDKDLLHFDDSEDEVGDEGQQAEGGKEEGEDEDDGATILTLQTLDRWNRSLLGGESFKGLRDLIRAFESACNVEDVVDTKGKDAEAVERAKNKFKFRIVSAQVFERLMRMCLTKMHIYLSLYLKLKPSEEGGAAPKKANPQSSDRWKRISLPIKA